MDKLIDQLLINGPLVAFAMVGGALGSIMRAKEKKEIVVFWEIAFESIVAGFAGILTILLLDAMGIAGPWAGFAVGTLGYAGGSAALTLFSSILNKKLGKN